MVSTAWPVGTRLRRLDCDRRLPDGSPVMGAMEVGRAVGPTMAAYGECRELARKWSVGLSVGIRVYRSIGYGTRV